jgi:hypothetical protein
LLTSTFGGICGLICGIAWGWIIGARRGIKFTREQISYVARLFQQLSVVSTSNEQVMKAMNEIGQKDLGGCTERESVPKDALPS